MVGGLVWEKGRKQPHPRDRLWLKEDSECRMEARGPSSSWHETLVPKSHHAVHICRGRVLGPDLIPPKSWVSWPCFGVGILCMLWQRGLQRGFWEPGSSQHLLFTGGT